MWGSLQWMIVFVGSMWGIACVDAFVVELNVYGIVPRTTQGIIGILTSNFLHANILELPQHLIHNTLFLLFVLPVLVLFYQDVAKKVVWFIILLSGTLVWMFGRGGSIHVGASGLIFGLLVFIFLSGFVRRQLTAVLASLILLVLYSVVVYGVLPKNFSTAFLVLQNILSSFLHGVLPSHAYVSWEAHSFGALAGGIACFVFRKKPLNE